MTSYKEALNWFYQWERSMLSGTEIELRLQEIFNPAISDADREKLLNTIVEEKSSSPILPELLFQIGAWYRRHGSVQGGLRYLDRALEEYSIGKDLHHLNCIQWLSGCILYQIGSDLEACLRWRSAIKAWKAYLPAFQERLHTLEREIENARLASLRCIEREEWHKTRSTQPGADQERHRKYSADYRREGQMWQAKSTELQLTKEGVYHKLDWYQKRLEEMEIALFCTPEEAYNLVKDISAGDLSRVCQGFINQRGTIEKLIADHQFTQAAEEIERMISVAEAWTPYEKAETQLVAGWALYEIKNDGWERHLKKAVFLYPPDSLARIWARWLLGAIQWKVSALVGDAAKNWTIAIQDMVYFEHEAEWQNRGEMVEYYAEKIPILRGALDLQRNQLPGAAQAGS